MIALGQNLVNHKTRLLHRRASVFEFLGHFLGGFFQGAIETIGPLGRWTLLVVRTIPLGGRIQDLAGPSNDADIVLAHWGLRIGWAAKFRVLRVDEPTKCAEQGQDGLHRMYDARTAERL